MRCDLCKEKPCAEGNPCVPKESRSLYLDPESARILAVGAEVEAKYYGMLCRLDEILGAVIEHEGRSLARPAGAALPEAARP